MVKVNVLNNKTTNGENKMEKKREHIVYKTTNNKNDFIYIGVHAQYQDDSYIGSGLALLRDVEKFGRENFTRETLATFDNREAAVLFEGECVNEDFVKRTDTYNVRIGGFGSGGGGLYVGKRHCSYGRVASDEERKKMSESIKASLKNKVMTDFEKENRRLGMVRGKVTRAETRAKKESNPSVQEYLSIMGEYEKTHGKIDYVKLNQDFQDSLEERV